MLEVTLDVLREKRILLARFARPQRFLSWAIVGGGVSRGRVVAWCQLQDGELTPEIDARALLSDRLARAEVPDAVWLLTGADVGRYVQQVGS